MDPENLKQFVELFERLGGEAKTAFVIWVIANSLIPIVIGLFWLVFGLVAVGGVKALISFFARIVAHGCQLARAYGTSRPGLFDGGELIDAERILREARKQPQEIMR